ncbi:MAG: hypothetical protein R3C16_02565 [Hyphomonadaceae bacterium]
MNEDAALVDIGLAVRTARMIDVARRVPARRAVDGFARVDLEQVLGAALLFLLLGELDADIFDDAGVLRNFLIGVEAKARLRTLHGEIEVAGDVAFASHGRSLFRGALFTPCKGDLARADARGVHAGPRLPTA